MYRFGPFTLKDNESLWVDEALIPLSPLQLRLLRLFCANPQQILGKERLAAEVWGRPGVSDVSLARAIHGLRSRLAVGGRPSELIRNIYGRGYILTQSVSVKDAVAPVPVAPLSVAGGSDALQSVERPVAPLDEPLSQLKVLRARPVGTALHTAP
jgi:DNA-binding winged helix-turn-helix (wHTH) protein